MGDEERRGLQLFEGMFDGRVCLTAEVFAVANLGLDAALFLPE